MSQEPNHKIIPPKLSTECRVPPSTPTSSHSVTSSENLSSQTYSTSFVFYSSTQSMGEERKELHNLQIKDIYSSLDLKCRKKRSVVLLHENKMNPKSVSEKNKAKFPLSDHILSFSQSPLLSSAYLTPATSLVTFDCVADVGSGKSRSVSSDNKKKNRNHNKSESDGHKFKIKSTTLNMGARDEKIAVSLPSPPNQSPTISLITLHLDESYPKSAVRNKLVDGTSDVKNNEKHRKGKSPVKESGEDKVTCSERKSDEKKSSTPTSRQKISSVSSVSPRNETSTNTTPHKYWRLPPHLENIYKHATSLFRGHSVDSNDSKENSCWRHLEAIYRNAGARIRLNSNENSRCMSCPGRKQEILSCPAFMRFSLNQEDLKVVPDSRSPGKYSSDDEATPSPCSPSWRSFDRSTSPGFTKHIKETWTNSVHADASDRSASDGNANVKEKSSKSFDSNREEGSVKIKSHNLNSERIVRFSIGTLTGIEEPVQSISSPEKTRSKFSSFIWNRRSRSRRNRNSQNVDSSGKPMSARSLKQALKHSASTKQRHGLLRKRKNPKTSIDHSTGLIRGEKSSNSAGNKDIDRVGENQPNETEVSSTRKIKFKPTTELIVDDKYKKDIAIDPSSHSLHKNRTPTMHSQKLFGERIDLYDFEKSSDKVSSSDVFIFATKRTSPISSNSDGRSTTSSSSDNLSNESSTIVSSSPDSEIKFQNQSGKSSTMKTDKSPRGTTDNSGQPMFAGIRKTNLSYSGRRIFRENKSVSVDTMKFVDRGSSPMGFHLEGLEGLLWSRPSCTKSKSTCESSTEVNKLKGVSKSQQTVPCVNLQYARFNAVVEANDEESDNGSSSPKSSSKPTILIPKMHSRVTSQIQRKPMGKNNLSSDSVKIQNKNPSQEKRDNFEISIQKNSNLEKSKVSQNTKFINNLSRQKTVPSADLNDTLCEVRDKKVSRKSEENTRKSFNSPRRETPLTPITRDKRRSSLKIRKPTVVRQRRKATSASFEKPQKSDVSTGTPKKEEISVKSTSDIQNPLRKQNSVIGDELKGKMSLNNINGRQTSLKDRLNHKEAIVESKVKSGISSSTQITDNPLNDDNSISDGKGKQTAMKVSFSLKGSCAETNAKTGYIVGTQRGNSNSRKQDSVAELLKDRPNPCSAKGQPISSTETKQKSGNIVGRQSVDANLKNQTLIIGILKDTTGNLGISNERQSPSKVSSPAKRNSVETKVKPGNIPSIQKEDNSLKKPNSLSVVEVFKDKTILSGVNGRQLSKNTSYSKESSVESKLKSSNSSTTHVEDNANKPNQVSDIKISTSGRQISTKISFSAKGNTMETKMKPENFLSTNLKDSSLKKQDSMTLTEPLKEKRSLSIVSKRQIPSRVTFLVKSNSVESKPKTANLSAARVDDNSLKKQKSFVADQSLKVKQNVSRTSTRLSQGKVCGTDGIYKLKTVWSTKRGESFSKSTKKVSKTQNALNSNSRKHKTRNTTAKKNPTIIPKVISFSRPHNTDVTSRPRSTSEHSIMTRTAETNGDTKSSSGPRYLGSETISGNTLPNQPSSYTVNTYFLPANQVWPGYLEHGQTQEQDPQYYCQTSRGIVCIPKKENIQYLNEVYYAVPVKFPFAGNTFRFDDGNQRHVGRGGSYDSFEDGQRYYMKTNRDERIYAPRRELVHPNDTYKNGRYLIPDPAMDTSSYGTSRSGTPANEHENPEEMNEENRFHSHHVSLPVASCPAFSVGSSAFSNIFHW